MAFGVSISNLMSVNSKLDCLSQLNLSKNLQAENRKTTTTARDQQRKHQPPPPSKHPVAQLGHRRRHRDPQAPTKPEELIHEPPKDKSL